MREQSTNADVLVVGATGLLGMEICKQLLADNKKVKALVRKSSEPSKIKALQDMGVETIEGDLKDPGSLVKALESVESVISTASSTMSRSDGDSIESVDHDGQLHLVDAASDARVRQFVFISFSPMSVEFPLQTAKREVEKKLMESGLNYTILQPTFFMEVWLSPAIGFDFPNAKATIYGDGKNKISWISLKDVAKFAVASLNKKEAMKSIFQLGGTETLSPLEVISLFEKQGGAQFSVQLVPREYLQTQRDQATDSLGKSFASLMMEYANGSEIDMTQAQSIFQIQTYSIGEYVNQSLQRLPETADQH